LARKEKTGVKLKVYVLGEDEKVAPFEDKLPEERFF
jgi:hypothetical protein